MANKEFNISLLHSSSSVFSYTFSTSYKYVLVFGESDYSNTGSLSFVTSTGTSEQLAYLLNSNSADYAGSHSGRTFLLRNVSSGDSITYSASKMSALHVYSLSTTLKNDVTFTSIGQLNSNSDSSDTTRTYTTDKYYDAVFIHTVMGEADEMNAHDTYGSNITSNWTFFTHSGHDGNTTGAMGSGYANKVEQGTSISVITQNHPISGYDELNSRSYIVFGLSISQNSGTIYKGSTDLSNIYLGNIELSAVYFREHNIWGGGTPLIPIEYDYVLNGTYNEVDIIYTTDTHLRWLGNAGSDYTYSPVFSLANVAYYKDKLWDAI